MTEQRQDRRKFKRDSSLNLISLELLDYKGNVATIVMGRTLDLTVKGTKMEIDEPILFLSAIKFEIVLKENILKVKGKVVYLNKIEENKFHCGVHFQDLSPEIQALIEVFLIQDLSKKNQALIEDLLKSKGEGGFHEQNWRE